MKKRIVAITLGILMAMSLAACGGGSDSASSAASSAAPAASEAEDTSAASSEDAAPAEEAAEPAAESEAEAPAASAEAQTVAFVPKTLNNPFFVAIQDSLQAGCDERGWTLKCNAADAETEVDKQVSIVEAFIQEGVDILILIPSDSTALKDVIDNAADQGIPTFLIDTECADSQYVSFAGTNNYEGGCTGAKWIGETVGSGDVAILDGYSGNDATTKRQQGFMDTIKDYPDINVVDSQYANCEIAMGMSVTENYITAYPDLKAIFAVNDMMAIGAGQAVAAAGKRDQIIICGFDGQPDAAQAIIDGEIDATIAQKPATMGTLTLGQIDAYLAGEDFEKDIDTGCDVVTPDNAETYLEWQ